MGYYKSNGVWRIYTETNAISVKGEKNAQNAAGKNGYLFRITTEKVIVKRGDGVVITVVTKEICPPGHAVDVLDGRIFVCRIERLSSAKNVGESLDSLYLKIGD
jgi:hypothetical protein